VAERAALEVLAREIGALGVQAVEDLPLEHLLGEEPLQRHHAEAYRDVSRGAL
jgi:hypothetical protein